MTQHTRAYGIHQAHYVCILPPSVYWFYNSLSLLSRKEALKPTQCAKKEAETETILTKNFCKLHKLFIFQSVYSLSTSNCLQHREKNSKREVLKES